MVHSSEPAASPSLERVQPSPNKHKRARAVRACDRCRLKKQRCDEATPCKYCKKQSLSCVYSGGQFVRIKGFPGDQSYVRSLEKCIDELKARIDASTSDPAVNAADKRPGAGINLDAWGSPSGPQSSGSTSPPIDGTQCSVLVETPGTPLTAAADGPGDALEGEGSEVNNYTNSVEFHGLTSSMAFLRCLHLRSRHGNVGDMGHVSTSIDPQSSMSLISALHNPAFTSQTSVASENRTQLDNSLSHCRRAHIFIEAYFDGLHVVTPVIDKEEFYTRAHRLWHEGVDNCYSFAALYLSIQSLGALIRVWDEDILDGMSRFEWSRKLFTEARRYLNMGHFSNDLDTVHCLMLMAKICQNELNPHMAYMYIGQAVRTCLAAGFDRESPGLSQRQALSISKTWWGLYCMDIEMSLAVGRPDTLGLDIYHNRRLPPMDLTEVAIIPCMVEFAKIMRRVAVEMYHSPVSLQQKLRTAVMIERDMQEWVSRLPINIRPDVSKTEAYLGGLKEPNWSRRQRLVLFIRYHTVRTILFRPFLACSGVKTAATPMNVREAISKCIDSARSAIHAIYDVLRAHSFFRSWWYNTTYVMFAATLLLLVVNSPSALSQREAILTSVDMAVQVLQAMDESIVAKQSAEIVSAHLNLIRESDTDSRLGRARSEFLSASLPELQSDWDLSFLDAMPNMLQDFHDWTSQPFSNPAA